MRFHSVLRLRRNSRTSSETSPRWLDKNALGLVGETGKTPLRGLRACLENLTLVSIEFGSSQRVFPDRSSRATYKFQIVAG